MFSKGIGQKTKQQLLKEESEKMKVFAQQLRSKPQFIAVFKVRHKSYELFQDFKAFQNSIEQALVLLKPP